MVSTLSEPAFEKYVEPPDFTTRNESSLMAISRALFVEDVPPCSVIFVVIAATCEPRPICFALEPAAAVAASGPVAGDVVW